MTETKHILYLDTDSTYLFCKFQLGAEIKESFEESHEKIPLQPLLGLFLVT